MLASVALSMATLALSSCKGLDAAEKAYNLGEYQKAATIYESLQKAEQNKGVRGMENFYLGECYRNLGVMSKASTAYKRAISFNYDDDDALLRLAECYRVLGKFDEAQDAYEQYAQKHKTDRRASEGLASIPLGRDNWTEMTSKKTSPVDSGYVISPMKEFNASKYSDFCPAYVGDAYDAVYFTSMRTQKKHRKSSKITGQGHATLYMSRIDGRGKWTTPEPMDEPFGQSQVDDGVACISADGRTMLFTRCPLNDEEGNPAQCFEMKREGGRWSDPVRVTPGGDSTMMVAHPAISPDGQTIYFVSDKEEGGHGGKDIWMALRNTDDSWGPAQNLGPMINSQGDEMFPYVRQDGSIYFSSNGHKGYGGLDIYRAVMTDAGRYEVTNMGLPINSQGDDFGIAFMGSAEEGLLSSNRDNSRGVDNIYSFYLPPVILTIEGFVGEVEGGVLYSPRPALAEAGAAQADSVSADVATVSKPAGNAKASTAKSSPKKSAAKSNVKSNAKSTANASATKGASKSGSKSTVKASPSSKAKQTAAVEKKIVPVKNSFVRIVGSDGTNIKLSPSDDGLISFVAERDVHYLILSGAPGYANVRTEISTEGLNRTQTLKFTAKLEKIN